MRLKDFHETFKSDLQDLEFVLGYLQDCLEEGGIALFISALKDVVQVHQNSDIYRYDDEQQRLFKEFLYNQEPTFLNVYQVIKALGFHLDLQLQSSQEKVA